MFNPLMLLEYKNRFLSAHPDVMPFLARASARPVPAGSQVSITLQRPGEAAETLSLTVSEDDQALINELVQLAR